MDFWGCVQCLLQRAITVARTWPQPVQSIISGHPAAVLWCYQLRFR